MPALQEFTVQEPDLMHDLGEGRWPFMPSTRGSSVREIMPPACCGGAVVRDGGRERVGMGLAPCMTCSFAAGRCAASASVRC